MKRLAPLLLLYTRHYTALTSEHYTRSRQSSRPPKHIFPSNRLRVILSVGCNTSPRYLFGRLPWQALRTRLRARSQLRARPLGVGALRSQELTSTGFDLGIPQSRPCMATPPTATRRPRIPAAPALPRPRWLSVHCLAAHPIRARRGSWCSSAWRSVSKYVRCGQWHCPAD